MMFSILDMPEHTTLERAREAIRFGGINLDEVVRYLKGGTPSDRLAQAEYYSKMDRKVRRDKILALSLCGAILVIAIILTVIKFTL